MSEDSKDLTNFDIVTALNGKAIVAAEQNIEVVTFAEQQLEYFQNEQAKFEDRKANLDREIEEMESIIETVQKALKKLEKNRTNVEIALSTARVAVETLKKGGILGKR